MNWCIWFSFSEHINTIVFACTHSSTCLIQFNKYLSTVSLLAGKIFGQHGRPICFIISKNEKYNPMLYRSHHILCDDHEQCQPLCPQSNIRIEFVRSNKHIIWSTVTTYSQTKSNKWCSLSVWTLLTILITTKSFL